MPFTARPFTCPARRFTSWQLPYFQLHTTSTCTKAVISPPCGFSPLPSIRNKPTFRFCKFCLEPYGILLHLNRILEFGISFRTLVSLDLVLISKASVHKVRSVPNSHIPCSPPIEAISQLPSCWYGCEARHLTLWVKPWLRPSCSLLGTQSWVGWRH